MSSKSLISESAVVFRRATEEGTGYVLVQTWKNTARRGIAVGKRVSWLMVLLMRYR